MLSRYSRSGRLDGPANGRGTTFGVGIVLGVVGIAVSAALNDSALASVITLTGCVPAGVKLFERFREEVAKRVARGASDTVTISDSATATTTGKGHGGAQATIERADAIRSATTFGELVDAFIASERRLSERTDELEREVRRVKGRARKPRSPEPHG